jgi:hypothetical protein
VYFEIVKAVLDQAIAAYCQQTGQAQAIVDGLISEHIAHTRYQHYQIDPAIDYADPLCRLGYLFTHAGANGWLFRHLLDCAPALQGLLAGQANTELKLATLGGGPGTELLGLTDYLCTSQLPMNRLSFSVLDLVPQWGESWNHLASGCRQAFQKALGVQLMLDKSFYPVDVTDPNGCAQYAWLLGEADLMIFNYLLSENQVHMASFQVTLQHYVNGEKPGCYFAFIDRNENNANFIQQTQATLQGAHLNIIQEFFVGSYTVPFESTPLQSYESRFGQKVRRWLVTRPPHREPTAFFILGQKV